MSKILFVANVHQHFLDCHLPYIAWLTEQGHDVHVAAGGTEVVPYASGEKAKNGAGRNKSSRKILTGKSDAVYDGNI